MPTPPMSDDLAREAVALVNEHGNKEAASRASGIPRGTLSNRYRVGIERGFGLSPGPRLDALENGVLPGHVKSGWTKTKGKDGEPDHSFYWTAPPVPPEDILSGIEERLQAVLAAPAVTRPKETREDRMDFLGAFDAHQRLAGANNAQRLREAVSDVLERAPGAASCVILEGGDFTHQNDESNQTPRSKHPLDVDGGYVEALDEAEEALIWMVELARQKYDHVIVAAIKGNHDPHTAVILRAALRATYRNDDGVTFLDNQTTHFHHEWEGNLLLGHHGHSRVPKKDFCMALIERHREAFGRCKCVELHTGHFHHEKVIEYPGIKHRQSMPLSALSRHELDEGYGGVSGIELHTYRKGGGRCGSTVFEF